MTDFFVSRFRDPGTGPVPDYRCGAGCGDCVEADLRRDGEGYPGSPGARRAPATWLEQARRTESAEVRQS